MSKRLIHDFEDLADLPYGTIVMCADKFAWQRFNRGGLTFKSQHLKDWDGAEWAGVEFPDRIDSSSKLPFTVLYNPTEDDSA